MMHVIIENDRVARLISGDLVPPPEAIEVPATLRFLPADRLAWDGVNIIDAAGLESFFIDANGAKYACAGAERVQVSCNYDDELVQTPTGWRIFDPLVDELERLKKQHIAKLSATCALKIVSGFVSNALGEDHTYPSDATAQINLMGSVMDSILPNLPSAWTTPFWTANAGSEWAFRPHSAAQIQQAGRDGKLHVVSCQSILEALSTQVMAAGTAAEIVAIIWPEGDAV